MKTPYLALHYCTVLDTIMRKWTRKGPKKTILIDILLFDLFSNYCLANLVEPFRAANSFSDHKLYQWRFKSLDGTPVRSSSGLDVATEIFVPNESQPDYLMIISGYGYRSICTSKLIRTLKQADNGKTVIAGLDTGSWLMAYAGLLDGEKATIHADVFDAFSESFFELQPVRDRFRINGNRITCGGASAAFDLVLRLINDHHGEALRYDVASLFLQATDRRDLNTYDAQTRSTLAAKAMEIMDRYIEEPIAISKIAAGLNVSSKKLQREFLKTFGVPPTQVYRHKRLLAGRKLIQETDISMPEIAVRCGYQCASAFTRAFHEEFSETPTDARNSVLK